MGFIITKAAQRQHQRDESKLWQIDHELINFPDLPGDVHNLLVSYRNEIVSRLEAWDKMIQAETGSGGSWTRKDGDE